MESKGSPLKAFSFKIKYVTIVTYILYALRGDSVWVEQYYWNREVYPTVDPAIFKESAYHFQLLFKDANKITGRITEAGSFASKLMDHAQKNEKKEAISMLKGLSLDSDVDMRYTPEMLSIVLTSTNGCCQLVMRLRWH